MSLLKQAQLLGCSLLGVHSWQNSTIDYRFYVSRFALLDAASASTVEIKTRECRHCGTAKEVFKKESAMISNPTWKPLTP